MFNLIFRHIPIKGPCSDIPGGSFATKEALLEVARGPRRSGLVYATGYIPYIDHPNGARERLVDATTSS